MNEPKYAKDENKEVPAGPGDAGRSDRAEMLPGVGKTRSEGRQATILVSILTLIGLLAVVLLSSAA